jgi:hypothetical protein
MGHIKCLVDRCVGRGRHKVSSRTIVLRVGEGELLPHREVIYLSVVACNSHLRLAIKEVEFSWRSRITVALLIGALATDGYVDWRPTSYPAYEVSRTLPSLGG